jgi:hypothetical protein
MHNIYLYRSNIIDARIPITVFYNSMCELKLINNPLIFCDSYPKNLSKINAPILSTILMYNVAYNKPVFFVDSLKDIETVKNIVPQCKFILFNDQKLMFEDKDDIYNFVVENDTKLEDLLHFLQESEGLYHE